MMRLPTPLLLLAAHLVVHYPSSTLSASPPVLVNGLFQYQLANLAVLDITAVDYGGDDCPALPCPAFALPSPSCAVAQSLPQTYPPYGWSAPFVAIAGGLTPTTALLPAYTSDTSWLVGSNATHVWLTDAAWGARILLQCGIPCPAGTYLFSLDPTATCTPCPPGTWSAAGVNATACTTCTNAPLNSVYTSASVTSPACPFMCPTGTFAQPDSPYAPLLLISSGIGLQALLPNGNSSIQYSFLVGQVMCIEAAGSLGQVYFASASTIFSMGLQPYRAPLIIATGFTFVSSIRLFQNGTTLLVVDEGTCTVKMLSLTNPSLITTIVGSSGACAFADGPGASARLRYPVDLIVDHEQGVAYIADEYNYRVRMLSLAPPYNVTTLVGSGIPGQLDAVGTAATIDPYYLALSTATNTLYVRCPGLIRRVDLATLQVTTIASGIQSSATGLALGPSSGLLYYSMLKSKNPGSISNNLIGVSTMRLPSYTAIPYRTIDGGAQANWVSVVVVNETWGGIAAATTTTTNNNNNNRTGSSTETPICASCVVCAPGRFAQCNTTFSACIPCPTGTYSTAAGSTSTSCSACPVATFGPTTGLSACLSCPNGTFAKSPGASVCAQCPANTFSVTPSTAMCTGCAPGTYADRNGSGACQRCLVLPYLATWTAPSPASATLCPFACPGGTVFNGTACGGCDIGTWSSSSAACFPCTNLPANAIYSGVGSSATTCAYKCNAGYLPSPTTPATPCAPCAPGTRYLASSCTPCNPGAYAPLPASTACLACPSGAYALAGSTTCTACAVPNNTYTVFVGRGTSPTCAFYCKPGSMLNRTNPSPSPASCAQCPAGTYAAAPSSTACTACAGGTWAAAGATACAACLV